MELEKYDELLKKFNIDTAFEKAAFYAQVAHESANFSRYEENLNYSAEALMKTWPKRFDSALAHAYAHKPEKIANYVYANRMGNGNEKSGDGWRFRGAGFIQLTGKEMHSNFAQYMGISLLKVPDYFRTENGAMVSACWFWKKNGLSAFVDDFAALTRRINGGLVGLKERKALFEHYKKVFGVK